MRGVRLQYSITAVHWLQQDCVLRSDRRILNGMIVVTRHQAESSDAIEDKPGEKEY